MRTGNSGTYDGTRIVLKISATYANLAAFQTPKQEAERGKSTEETHGSEIWETPCDH